MSRLIDADELHIHVADVTLSEGITWLEAEIVHDFLDNAPTIEAEEVRHGKWIPHPTEREWDVCDNCGTGCKRREYGENEYDSKWVTEYNYPYCPNCGAKMDKE